MMAFKTPGNLEERSLDTFFHGQPLSRQIFDALRVLIEELGLCGMAVTR